jgi:CRP-like cAMP-binding protein
MTQMSPLFERLDDLMKMPQQAKTVLRGTSWALGSSLYRVMEGAVALDVLNPGTDRMVLDFAVPGDYLSRVFYPVTDPTCRVEPLALVDTRIVAWEGIDAAAALAEARVELLEHLQRGMGLLTRRLNVIAKEKVPGRVLDCMRILSERFGEHGKADPAGWVRLPVWMTHLQIARYIGTRREIMSASCGELRDKGILRSSGSGMTRQNAPGRILLHADSMKLSVGQKAKDAA